MCKMASFLYRNSEELGLELAVHDLTSHGNTQAYFKDKTENAGWYEGHYLPNGKIQCRTPQGIDMAAQRKLQERYPRFVDFFSWAIHVPGVTIEGWLDLSGLTSAKDLDLKGVTIEGWLYLDGLTSAKDLDLKGVTIGGWLYLSGLTSAKDLDLKGVTIGGGLDLSGLTSAKDLDLKGVTIGGWLDLRGLTSAERGKVRTEFGL